MHEGSAHQTRSPVGFGCNGEIPGGSGLRVGLEVHQARAEEWLYPETTTEPRQAEVLDPKLHSHEDPLKNHKETLKKPLLPLCWLLGSKPIPNSA